MPVRSAKDMAHDNILVPVADLEDKKLHHDAWHSFPDLPDDDEHAICFS